MSRPSISRRVARIAALALAATALAAGQAGAGTTLDLHLTTLKISTAFPAFHGKVKADRAFCVKNRKVKLFEKRFGRDKLLGSDRTNAKGRWKVVVEPLASGAYYAVVRVKLNRAGTDLCTDDTSPTIPVD